MTCLVADANPRVQADQAADRRLRDIVLVAAEVLTHDRSRSGGWLAAGAYSIWGLFPLYWKLIEDVPAMQLIAHRIVWSFLVLIPVALSRAARGAAVRTEDDSPSRGRIVALYALAGALIAVNWFLYVWAVNHDFIVETSLGYFITPLVSVLLGVVILGERLRRWQWVAVLFAAAGVAYLTWSYGTLPWIAVGLALSFGTYGFVKKKAPYPALLGLTIETGTLLLPAIAYLLLAERAGVGAFGHTSATTTFLMAASGIVTTVPLLMFATAAQRVPLSLLGIIQYISPTLQFVIGVFVYDEPFSRQQLIGFSLVWCALGVFGTESATHARRLRPALTASS
jgi:chloramphenicol-sensitive protein RarD